MIGSSKNNRKLSEKIPLHIHVEKETQFKFNSGLSPNWPSNNWALGVICNVSNRKTLSGEIFE